MSTAIKVGTTPTLQISIPAVDIELVRTIEFVFKRSISKTDTPLLTLSYPDGGVIYSDGLYNIWLSDEQTRLFPLGKVHMDTRIVYSDGSIPATEITEIEVTPTLFNTAYTSE